MRSLIIGAAGFVGYYLANELLNNGDEVYCTKLNHEKIDNSKAKVVDLDICDAMAVKTVLAEVKPDAIYHLAAQSSVALSWKRPALTAQINIVGTINVLEAAREIVPEARILLVGSSEEYGPINLDRQIKEDDISNPKNIYALTKLSVEHLGKMYAQAYKMNIFMTRSFNHIGPRQIPQFVVADFASQVAKIEAGEQEPIIRVGNLESYRDFTDVRDIVCAYRIIVNKSQTGEVYNVGSGHAIKIRDILDLLLSESKVKISVEIDKSRFRPIDIKKIEANVSKIESLGWTRRYAIKDTIIDVLNYFRK